MRLTKDMKLTVIMGLVGQAAKKQAPAMTKEVKAVSKKWGQLAHKYVALYLPEVSPARWPEMIQDGLCRSFSTPKVTKPYGTNSTSTNELGYVQISYDSNRRDDYGRVRSALKASGWSALEDIMSVNMYDNYGKIIWYVSAAQIPSLSFMAKIDARQVTPDAGPDLESQWTQEAFKLSLECEALSQKFLTVIEESVAYYDELEIILASVNTDTVLANLFPEAMKYLPRPEPKNNQQLAPQELVNNARKKLLEGIPD